MKSSSPKLGQCRPCVLLSSTLAIAAFSSLLVSLTGSLRFSGTWLSVVSAGGLGFFAFLTVAHLAARIASDRARRRWQYDLLRRQLSLLRRPEPQGQGAPAPP